MVPHAVIELELAIGHAAHEIDAPARTLIFVARFNVRRTGRRTQTTMDTVQQQLIIEHSAWVGGRSRIVVLVGHASVLATEITEIAEKAILKSLIRQLRGCSGVSVCSVATPKSIVRETPRVEDVPGIELAFDLLE